MKHVKYNNIMYARCASFASLSAVLFTCLLDLLLLLLPFVLGSQEPRRQVPLQSAVEDTPLALEDPWWVKLFGCVSCVCVCVSVCVCVCVCV